MLSRLSFKSGDLLRFGVLCRQATTATTSAPTTGAKTINGCPVYPEVDTSIEARLKNWDEANKLFFSAQRDEKNFPLLKRPEECPPTRLVFMPKAWFDNFYEKTGVTGPYALVFGLSAFLLSKEIVMIEHQFTHFVSYWLAFYIVYRKWGSKISESLQKATDKVNNEMFVQPVELLKKQSEETIKDLEKVEWREEGQKYLWQSKKENVDLQLESAYRQRLGEVHNSVKRRLDYLVEKEATQRRIEQTHMSKWIVDNVVKSITPQQEKDALSKCIADLKALSQKHAAA